MATSDGYLIGIDQGTTNTKAVLVDTRGRVRGAASRPIPVATPRPGWAEQDPEVMFANAVACVQELVEAPDAARTRVIALGLCNQTETLVLWDAASGRPVHPAIIWQCRRSAGETADLDAPETVSLIRRRTGLDLDPTFTATKLRWVMANLPEVAQGLRDGSVLFGTVDCWLIWKLTGGRTYATESGNASRTMLFRIDQAAWDDDLFNLFELSLARRPEVRRSTGPFGWTDRHVLGFEVPIAAALGDQQAALFGHGCHRPGEIKVTYGTGAFLWANAGQTYTPREEAGFLQTIAWHLERPTYAFEGFVMYAGAILDWLVRHLGLGADPREIERAAREVGDSEGVSLVPAFQGLASPWWQAEARAAILGLSAGSRRAHVCHAALEAICFQIRCAIESMRDEGGVAIRELRVDGGPTKSAYLMQMQADVVGLPLRRAAEESVTALGAALMAGHGAGVWTDCEQIHALIRPGPRIEPSPARGRRAEPDYQRWLEAVAAIMDWSAKAVAHR